LAGGKPLWALNLYPQIVIAEGTCTVAGLTSKLADFVDQDVLGSVITVTIAPGGTCIGLALYLPLFLPENFLPIEAD
jgi:cadmium resistance protein CadD (predicted permease)